MSKIKISAELVKNLREKTGASVMECRNALAEAAGNLEQAIENLQKRGKEKAVKKANRATAEGVVASYIHSNKKIGALVEIFCETDFVAKNSEFQELAHNIAMHIAATDPKYLSAEKVDSREKSDYEEFARKEFLSGEKPAEILEKMVLGKVKKHFEETSLLSQPYVKNPDITIEDLLKEKIAKIGENIRMGSFVRFKI